MSPSPLQLYIHIPYCLHKCPYCDFNSHVRETTIPWADYSSALTKELAYWAKQPQYQNRKLSSLFFGGGTPSLSPPKLIESIIDAANKHLGLMDSAEISLEANPGAVDAGHFAAYRQAGVNRLSIGVQSFNNKELHWLERIHESSDAVRAYETARQTGFDNINLDLIYALPNQSIDLWTNTLDQAIDLSPEHLSCYQLTVEPHTLLASRHAKRPYPLPDDELSLQFLCLTRERLASAGFDAYEVSNFAQPDRYCRHNDGYWRYHDYIGIGAGASGKWDAQKYLHGAMDDGTHRYTNTRSPEGYMQQIFSEGVAIGIEEQLDRRTAAAEAIWMGLRRQAGLNRQWFNQRFDEDVLNMFSPELERWLASGMIQTDADSIWLSKRGIAQADSVATDLF